MEREADRNSYARQTESAPAAVRRAAGLTWYPIAIRGTEPSRGDYITVEVERTTHQDISHQLRFGASAALFSNHNAGTDRVEGTVAWQSGNRLKITLRTEELPDWAGDGKLGIDLLFDDNSYEEMQHALKAASALAEKGEDGKLIRILTGAAEPTFDLHHEPVHIPALNESQEAAVNRILAAGELAVVHGPPGTGKTTTLVQAIRALHARDSRQILVVAPSNTAVDLLSERLSDAGMAVLRVGNPARVSERLMSLTLDSRMAEHPSNKEIKKLKKQAAEFKNMAHKYKRSFGRAEREQRKALFDEAHRIMRDVGKTEQYIMDDVLARADVITATLVGANHYTVRQLRYGTVVIDEAGQALEPACWIPILKGQKLVLAGDHLQLPPTIKSEAAARDGLSTTLLEKSVTLHPDAVTLLEVQYRMNGTIMGFSSEEFYNGRLQAHETVANRVLFDGAAPLQFIDTAGCGFEEKPEGTSTTNPEEAAFLLRQLSGLVEELSAHDPPESFPTIAVISPYKEQVRLLAELAEHAPGLAPVRSSITINTIDSFQGQERDVVFIGLTRSNTDGVIGFLADTRRMNVAMTRARKKLVVVGDSATLSILPFYADFIRYAEEHNAYQSAWELMDV